MLLERSCRERDCMKSGKSENNEYYRLQDLPYERFAALGAENLTDAELLAILLRTGTRGVSAKGLGERVLAETARYGNGLLGLYHIPEKELKRIEGIGSVKAVQLKAVAEFARRMARAKAKGSLSFRDPYTVADYYMELFRHESVEQIRLLLLDSALHLTGEEILSKGTVNASLLSPREVYAHAFRGGAANIMLLHNHPGGNPVPSGNDIEITERIWRVGAMADIPLLDHIILGDNCYFSFRESKLLTDVSQDEEKSNMNVYGKG